MNLQKWIEGKTVQEKIEFMREMLMVDAVSEDDFGFLKLLDSIKADVEEIQHNNLALLGLTPIQLVHFRMQLAPSIAHVISRPSLEHDLSQIWMYDDKGHFIQSMKFSPDGTYRGMDWEEWAIRYANENKFNAVLLDNNGCILGTTDELQKPVNPDDRVIDWIDHNPGPVREGLGAIGRSQAKDTAALGQCLRSVVMAKSRVKTIFIVEANWGGIGEKYWKEWGYEEKVNE